MLQELRYLATKYIAYEIVNTIIWRIKQYEEKKETHKSSIKYDESNFNDALDNIKHYIVNYNVIKNDIKDYYDTARDMLDNISQPKYTHNVTLLKNFANRYEWMEYEFDNKYALLFDSNTKIPYKKLDYEVIEPNDLLYRKTDSGYERVTLNSTLREQPYILVSQSGKLIGINFKYKLVNDTLYTSWYSDHRGLLYTYLIPFVKNATVDSLYYLGSTRIFNANDDLIAIPIQVQEDKIEDMIDKLKTKQLLDIL